MSTSTQVPARTVPLASAGLCLVAVCYGLARFAYGLFVPAFRESFALDAATTGAIAAASYVAYCVGIIVSTVLTPRWGARLMAVAAGVLATAGTTVIALAPGALVLAAGVAIAGASTGVVSPPLAQAIAHRVPERLRDRTQTLVNSGTGLGVMVSGPVALMAQDHWRTAWLVFAGISLAVTVWAAVVVPSARTTSTDQPQRSRHPVLPFGALRLCIASILMGAASAATWTFGQDLLTTVGQHGQTGATIAWIALGACGLLGGLAGIVATRIGLAATWVGAVLGMGLTTAVLAAVPGSYPLAFTASALFGGLYIALTGVVLVWGTQVFADQPARGVGLAFLLVAVGQAAAAPLLGVLADQSGLPSAFWAATVLAAGCALARPPASPFTAATPA